MVRLAPVAIFLWFILISIIITFVSYILEKTNDYQRSLIEHFAVMIFIYGSIICIFRINRLLKFVSQHIWMLILLIIPFLLICVHLFINR